MFLFLFSSLFFSLFFLFRFSFFPKKAERNNFGFSATRRFSTASPRLNRRLNCKLKLELKLELELGNCFEAEDVWGWLQVPLARLSRSPSTKRLAPKPKRSTRRCAALPLSGWRSCSTCLPQFLSLYALIFRKYKLLLTNCIRSVYTHLNVCLDALSRLISVRLAQIKYTQLACVCVCVCVRQGCQISLFPDRSVHF